MISLEIGQKVIVRSNEDEPLLIGTIVGFEDFGNVKNYAMPIVESLNGGSINPT
jgi:hypothetical protein